MDAFCKSHGSKAITNVLLCDGSGGKPFAADVVIEGDLIKAVGKAGELNLTGIPTFDAKGKILAPGFIDVHSHSDVTALMYPECDSRISQGTTTEIIGNCGSSTACFLTSRSARQAVAKKMGEEPDWYDLRTYAEAVNRRRVAVNLAALAGHNTLRIETMGMEDRTVPTPTEMRMMKERLAAALEQGAAGLSSGLYYLPSRFCETPEVCELASLLKGTNKPYATHMRNESNNIINAIRESAEIARAGNGILEISHFKVCMPENWSVMDDCLAEVQRLQREGLRVSADCYPYLYFSTGIIPSLPQRWTGIPELKKYFQAHPELVKEAVADINSGEKFFLTQPGAGYLRSAEFPGAEKLVGKSFHEIAALWGVSVGEAIIKIILDSAINPAGSFMAMCQENLEKTCRNSWVMPGSDGYSINFNHSATKEHPRSFGTMPRFFQTARKFAPVEQVIARMTALPAKTFNLPYRGLVKPGYYADLVIFDPEKFNAPENYADPHHAASGVELVIVNGGIAFEGNNPAKRGRHGRFIKVK